MIFGLCGARNGSEHVLRRSAHCHHAVSFQLAEVDDLVRLVQPCGIGEGLRLLRLGVGGVFDLKIAVQLSAKVFDRLYARGGVDPIQVDLGVDSSGAVPHDDPCAPFLQQAHQGAQQDGVGGRRRFGLQERDQIGFDRYGHSVLDPTQPAEGGKGLEQRLLRLRRIVLCTGNDGYVHGANLRCFS